MKYDDNNIFAKILRNEIPSIRVYEDELTLAFMDVMPQLEGHVLVIPKEAAVTLYDLSDEAAAACFKTIKIVGKAVEKALSSEGMTLFQHNGEGVGQTVPHVHFHVLPGSIFDSSALKGHGVEMADQDELQLIATKIRQCLAK